MANKPQFEFTGGRLCLDFVNTVDNRNSPSPADLLANYASVVDWAQQAGIISEEQAQGLKRDIKNNPVNAQTAAMHAVAFRECMFSILVAMARGESIPSGAIERFNRMLSDAGSGHALTYAERQFRWRWVTPPHHLEWILWPIALDAADLLTGNELSLVRECASLGCGWLFVDRSKNHRRRWCEMKVCGNREKARRFYARSRAT